MKLLAAVAIGLISLQAFAGNFLPFQKVSLTFIGDCKKAEVDMIHIDVDGHPHLKQYSNEEYNRKRFIPLSVTGRDVFFFDKSKPDRKIKIATLRLSPEEHARELEGANGKCYMLPMDRKYDIEMIMEPNFELGYDDKNLGEKCVADGRSTGNMQTTGYVMLLDKTKNKSAKMMYVQSYEHEVKCKSAATVGWGILDVLAFPLWILIGGGC